MATQVTIKAEKRSGSGKGAARKLRAGGRVPGVVYGRDAETISVSVETREAQHLFQTISVENTIVELDVKGIKGSFPTLVREIQVHPLKADLLHIDFYRIQEGVKVEVEIPVHLNGVPEGVKHSGGILQQVIHDLPVSVLPSKIPQSIEVDVTGLDMNEAIHVYDLEISRDEDIEILVDHDRTVASVVAPKALVVEEEEEEAEELEIALVEGELPEGEELEEGEEAEAETEEDEEA